MGLVPFAQWCAGLSLVRTTERSIEGQMSRIGSVYRRARRASPAYVDMELRFGEFETQLMKTPRMSCDLADEYDRLCRRSGTQDLILSMLLGPVQYSGPPLSIQTQSRLIYRDTTQQKFRSAKVATQALCLQAWEDRMLQKIEGDNAISPSSSVFLQHFRRVCNAYSFFSMALTSKDASSIENSLSVCMRDRAPIGSMPALAGCTIDVVDEGTGGVDNQGVDAWFFRVAHDRPSRNKRLHKAKDNLSDADLLVNVYQVHSKESDSEYLVRCGETDVSVLNVIRGLSCGARVIVDSMKQWCVDKTLHLALNSEMLRNMIDDTSALCSCQCVINYIIGMSTMSTTRVLSLKVRSDDMPDGLALGVRELVNVGALLDDGRDDEGYSSWLVTQKGHKLFHVLFKLNHPMPVYHVRTSTPLRDRSTWELQAYLQSTEQGWTCVEFNKRPRGVLGYSRGSTKQYYVKMD
eukprot:8287116-Pyramimonas_sp.AAC.1